MDEQYFRKAQPKNKLGRLLRKILRNRRILIVLLIAIPALLFFSFNNRGLLKRLSLESDKQALMEKNRQAQEEQRELQVQAHALDKDPKAIEKVAREKYGMIREGETVYKLKKK